MPYEPLSRGEKERLARVMLDLRSAMCVGNPAPIVAAMWRRHTSPEPGDWVMETSTIHGLLHPQYDRWTEQHKDALWDGQFTRFLRTEVRTHVSEEEDDEWSETVYVCENPDGTEYTWSNAELVVAPLERSIDVSRVTLSR